MSHRGEIVRAEPEVQQPERRLLDQGRLLIVAEHNRVLTFPAAEFFYEGPDVAVGEVVPQGKLIPPRRKLQPRRAHLPRRPDGSSTITLGQPFNVPPRDKLKLYAEWGIAASCA